MVAWPLIFGGVGAATLAADYLYRYWRGNDDVPPREPQELQIPHVEDGEPMPLILGRGRVRRPILAWGGVPVAEAGSVGNGWPTGAVVYRFSMYFVCGIGMNDGSATNGFHNIWIGEERCSIAAASAGAALAQAELPVTAGTDGTVGGQYQWYDGNSTQEHVDSGGAAVTKLGLDMLSYWAAGAIPGFRGYISTYLTNNTGQWYLGPTPTVAAHSFEVSSYVDSSSYPVNGTYARVGPDLNPIVALYDLLVSYFGKLGIPSSYIDQTSFAAAGMTLYAESHGYSRIIEDTRPGVEHIVELLRQIDATLYEDMTTGKLVIKLIRPDFVVADLPTITRDNCVELQGFSAGSWNGVANAIRVTYTNRDDAYRDGSALAKNPANAVGQDGQLRIQTRSFPGVTHSTLASTIAWRELDWVSRPIMKCRALLTREFVRLNPGDAVRVQYSRPDISNVVFRVVSVDRGTLGDGRISVELIQDAAYTFRRINPLPGGLNKSDFGPSDFDLGL